MSEIKYAMTILKEKLGNADKHNLHYQRFSIADMEAVWGVLAKCEKDYAEIKAQRDALAVECAALKDINAWCHTEAFQNMYREFKTAEAIGCPDVDCMHDAMMVAIMHAPKTQATDAYLNSLRAESLESFAHQQRVIADALPGHEAQRSHRITACRAEDFAKQLRAGEPS